MVAIKIVKAKRIFFRQAQIELQILSLLQDSMNDRYDPNNPINPYIPYIQPCNNYNYTLILILYVCDFIYVYIYVCI